MNHALQAHEASTIVDHLSNHLRLSNIYYVQTHIEVIKHLPIFTEIGHTSSISLLPGNKKWYLLPKNEEDSYGKIIYPSDKGGFLNADLPNLRYILEDILKIPRLGSYDYWKSYVIPFLESQQQSDLDKVTDKLFDKLPSLLDHDATFKDHLGRISFVPVGTFRMSHKQQITPFIKLFKPIDLYDPEENTLVDLVFEDEQVFPAGKYGIPKPRSSKKFLSNLKLLEMKSSLSPDDVISRINTIVKKKKMSDIPKDLIHAKALKLFRYIDDKWDTLVTNDVQNRTTRGSNTSNHALLKTILETEWIPTVDVSEKKVFSKPQNCYCQKDKDLVCLIAPILESKVKNKKFLKDLKWDTYPKIDKVLKQLNLCYTGVSNKQPPKNLEKICLAIYKYMDEAYQATDKVSKGEFDNMKRNLKNKPWILCGNTFYSVDKVVFRLSSEFQGNDSLIVELPTEYTRFKPLFTSMGFRNEIEIKDLILIIKNVMKGNMDKELSIDEIKKVIKVLEDISKIKRENHSEKLDGLLIPSTENKLVNLHEIQFDDMEDRIDEEVKREYKIAHRFVTQYIAKELGIQTLGAKICGICFYELNKLKYVVLSALIFYILSKPLVISIVSQW